MVIALIGLTFLVSRSCQQSQIKVSQEEAVATARAQLGFTPDQHSIRLLRQGLATKPFWVVVFYVRRGEDLVTRGQVYVDAKSGRVTKVTEVRARGKGVQESR
jgi:hypothetical protein